MHWVGEGEGRASSTAMQPTSEGLGSPGDGSGAHQGGGAGGKAEAVQLVGWQPDAGIFGGLQP